MTVGPPYWVEVLTKGGREIIWTTLPDKQVGYFCLPGLIPVGRYIPITPASFKPTVDLSSLPLTFWGQSGFPLPLPLTFKSDSSDNVI